MWKVSENGDDPIFATGVVCSLSGLLSCREEGEGVLVFPSEAKRPFNFSSNYHNCENSNNECCTLTELAWICVRAVVWAKV